MKTYKTIKFKQGNFTMVFFVAPADEIWDHFSINRRIDDKDEGYQRALSETRMEKIAKYVNSNNPLPISILVALENGKYDLIDNDNEISLHEDKDVGWVIDGQHRLAGAFKSNSRILLPVIGLIDIDINEQIKQFVIINREAKGVPTSLYYDLLKHLPKKSLADQTKERSADIADALRNNEESPFFGRIVVTTPPQKGEISLTTFVKAISVLVSEGKGILSTFSLQEQIKIIDNYFRAIKNVFPKYFNENDTIFFKTTGFGAIFKAFPVIFNYCLKHEKGFTVANASKILRNISGYDFNSWKKKGTGNVAETNAAEEIRNEIELYYKESGDGEKIRL